MKRRSPVAVAVVVMAAAPGLVLSFAIRGGGQSGTERTANAIVAADGSGQYRTVQEAINALPQNTSATRPWVIFVKAGTYRELVYLQREKRFVSLVGEDLLRTVITFDLVAT